MRKIKSILMIGLTMIFLTGCLSASSQNRIVKTESFVIDEDTVIQMEVDEFKSLKQVY